MKLDLVTNATVVDNAIRFVSQKHNEKLKSSDEDDKQPDHDEDKDQPEEEAREITIPTTNQVF